MSAATEQEDSVSDFLLSLHFFCYFFFITPLQAIFGQLQLQIVFLKTSFILI